MNPGWILYDQVARDQALKFGRLQRPDCHVRLREPLIPFWLWPRQIDWLERLQFTPIVDRKPGGINYVDPADGRR